MLGQVVLQSLGNDPLVDLPQVRSQHDVPVAACWTAVGAASIPLWGFRLPKPPSMRQVPAPASSSLGRVQLRVRENVDDCD